MASDDLDSSPSSTPPSCESSSHDSSTYVHEGATSKETAEDSPPPIAVSHKWGIDTIESTPARPLRTVLYVVVVLLLALLIAGPVVVSVRSPSPSSVDDPAFRALTAYATARSVQADSAESISPDDQALLSLARVVRTGADELLVAGDTSACWAVSLSDFSGPFAVDGAYCQ